MRVKQILWILSVGAGLCSSCAVRKMQLDGVYYSTCFMYDNMPSATLKIQSNHTFSYKLPYVDDLVNGEWQLSKDTLILTSMDFRRNNLMSPALKLTNLSNEDRMLMKSGRLFLLNEDGTTNQHCYLKKR